MPTAVAALADGAVTEVAAGAQHTLVRLAGGDPNPHRLAGDPSPRPGPEVRAFGSNVRGQLGVFIDPHGQVTRRSAVHWRSPPLACGFRGPYLITLLPKTLEVHHLRRERSSQSFPFRDALCAADGGDFFLAASRDAVYALLPPLGAPGVLSASNGGSASSKDDGPPRGLDRGTGSSTEV